MAITLEDLGKKIQQCASKDDIEGIKSQINNYKIETNVKIEKIAQQVENNITVTLENADRIDALEASVEMLKQEQLKNNICVSGVPPNLLINGNANDLIQKIATKLDFKLNSNQFSSYAVAQNKFIIVQFYNFKHKLQLLGKIRAKRSLMVEEVFGGQSNSQIYLNDHLTPFFNRLYLIARNAKKDGQIASATSYGGKIRARKQLDHPPTLITSEKQLMALINSDAANESGNTHSSGKTNATSHTDDMMNISHSTAQNTNNISATESSSTQNNPPSKQREKKDNSSTEAHAALSQKTPTTIATTRIISTHT